MVQTTPASQAASSSKDAGAKQPFYLPPQEVPTGAPLQSDLSIVPPLFHPLKIRGVTLHNRIVVSPMCMYSADDGMLTEFHFAHHAQFALRGPGAIFIEATAVTPEGRISPQDAGIWDDKHIAPIRRIADLVHSQKIPLGIQLAHAGRKASTSQPWRGYYRVTPEDGGWSDEQVVAPSAIAYDEKHADPREITKEEIEEIEEAFVAAAKRALAAGVDMVEVHGAHGYLIHSFLSPLSNLRTDEYGGSLENRMRFALEVTEKVRAVWPSDKPVFFRVSGTDWAPGGWDIEQTIELARRLQRLGVDVLDVSSGGNTPQQKIKVGPGYQVPLAEKVKQAIPDLLVSTVGLILNPHQANEIIASGKADLVMLAREFLRDPNFVLRAARDLGVDVQWPNQYHRAKDAFYKHP
ncbi:NADH:flavin oxidoreductase or 12-oxophytodienoate reductase [Klebsormidium nitens]|uniref:NADH:flavin oxidoreductase or 12-oxophytodienoate reductase n=1 Tax=Klebsormidium nitens TaxID=105231 RepID=A0A1Y1IDP9_KLENI|nr:NADH:flavin oxidoreductase or 12-oxophytodienoate reductase [Klebsormidium nitens]|eukprot:GAQ86826.1 NADH:flavin oxidoreductase or 12-oxophytodienoate reductase [Klebsormidium nitens]